MIIVPFAPVFSVPFSTHPQVHSFRFAASFKARPSAGTALFGFATSFLPWNKGWQAFFLLPLFDAGTLLEMIAHLPTAHPVTYPTVLLKSDFCERQWSRGSGRGLHF